MAVMDANERVESQSRRSSVKRPWEGDRASLQEVNAWHSSSLPPIDAVPHRRGSIQIGSHGGPIWDLDPDSVLKKAKLERHEYNTFPRQNVAPNGNNALPQNQSKLDQITSI